jgi:hypothetical protein
VISAILLRLLIAVALGSAVAIMTVACIGNLATEVEDVMDTQNVRPQYMLYNPMGDAVIARVEAPDGDEALDAWARSFGFPDLEEMQKAGMFQSLTAHRLN